MSDVYDPNNFNNELRRLLSYPDTYDFSLKFRLVKLGFYYSADKFVKCQFCPETLSLETPDLVIEPHVCADKNANIKLPEITADKCKITADYRNFTNRILSFLKKNWPKLTNEMVHVGALELALSGFYYTGEADVTRCIFCRLEVRGWERGNTAQSEHRRWSPHCPFLRKQIKDKVVDWKLTAFPLFSAELQRMASYKNWPVSMLSAMITKQRLVAAGFVYSGRGDALICFQCGLGLNDWSFNEDPIVSHAVWSPACTFLSNDTDNVQQYIISQTNIRGAADGKVIIPQGLLTYTSRPLNDQMWEECMREMNNPTTISDANFCQTSGNFVWRAL